MSGFSRCTPRKHVIERGLIKCDCGGIRIARTAAKNALVVTVIDPVQRDALAKIEPS